MRLPNDSQRHAIYGQTGSGKTVAGLWSLEQRSWHRQPWLIYDWKRDPTIARIPRLEEVSVTARLPRHAGLYVVRPMPHDIDEVEAQLWQVWQRGRTGLFVDEVYRMGRFNKAFDAIMTQGRSKRIPVIGCSQRPSWLAPFYMSESDFHQVLHVPHPDDWRRLQQWIPDLQATRRDFTSQYYDVARGEMTRLKPVPDEEEILDRFDRKMPRKIKLFTGLTINATRKQRSLTAAKA
jgi:hypothetical protein